MTRMVTRKRKREELRAGVWANHDLRRLIFSFYVSPTRVFMARVPRLPFIARNIPTRFVYGRAVVLRQLPFPNRAKAWLYLKAREQCTYSQYLARLHYL